MDSKKLCEHFQQNNLKNSIAIIKITMNKVVKGTAENAQRPLEQHKIVMLVRELFLVFTSFKNLNLRNIQKDTT